MGVQADRAKKTATRRWLCEKSSTGHRWEIGTNFEFLYVGDIAFIPLCGLA
jgi:hypothetical protein